MTTDEKYFTSINDLSKAYKQLAKSIYKNTIPAVKRLLYAMDPKAKRRLLYQRRYANRGK
jgi:hypothetical protein